MKINYMDSKIEEAQVICKKIGCSDFDSAIDKLNGMNKNELRTDKIPSR